MSGQNITKKPDYKANKNNKQTEKVSNTNSVSTNNVSKNTTQTEKVSSTSTNKNVNKKVIFSELINEGVCVHCLFGSCKNHQTLDERIPENIPRYVKNPSIIRNFGEELIKCNFGIEGTPRYTTCKFMLNKCDNCNNGRCITMKYQSNDITLCYSNPSNGAFFVGAHIDIHYEEKFKGFDLTIFPFNSPKKQHRLNDNRNVVNNNVSENTEFIDDDKSISSNISNISSNVNKHNETKYSDTKQIDTSNISYASIANKSSDEVSSDKYNELLFRYNKLNDELIFTGELIEQNNALNYDLNKLFEINNNLKDDNNKLFSEIKLLKKEIETLRSNNKLLNMNLESNRIHYELDNVVSRQIINTHIDRYTIFNENM
jgi:hypothetical protein